jgi:hypothetical protein
MSLKPFEGSGSTPPRRKFWNEARNAVLGLRKIAGHHVTVDEHPGKGTVINVADTRARRKDTGGGKRFAGNLPTLYCDFRSVHLTKAGTFPPLLSPVPQCIGQYLTRTATLSWRADYHADDYPSVGQSLDITHITDGTETVTLDTDGNVASASRSGSTSTTRSDGNHTCSASLVADTPTTNVCLSFYDALYPHNWYKSYFHGTQQDPPNPATNHASCVGCTGGGGVVPSISCTGPDTVNNSYYGTHHTGICAGNFYEGWQNGICQKADSGTVGFPASGGSWSWSWNWTIGHSNEYTLAMFIQKAKDALTATAYPEDWHCRLGALDCRAPDFPCTYAPYDASDACGCNGYRNLFNDDLEISVAQFRYYLRVNDSDAIPPTGTTLLWDEETTYDSGPTVDAPMSFSFDGTSRETDVQETPVQDENSTTIIANVRWQ